jgi:urease accessory protein
MGTVTGTTTVMVMSTITRTTPVTPTAMTTGTEPESAPATALLSLLWLASPALPVGGFSYSEGLEAAVEAGTVHDEATARAWLLDQAELVLARSELPLVAAAHAAWLAHDSARIDALNTWALTTRESAEFRLQTEQMGRSLADWHRQSAQAADPRVATLAGFSPGPSWPVAFALGTALAGATAREALLAFGFAWCEQMAQAAIKAVPLGQVAAQRLLAALVQRLPALVDDALAAPESERQAFAPLLAIRSAQHETQYSRLFRS